MKVSVIRAMRQIIKDLGYRSVVRSSERSYEDAVKALNGLQSNAAVLAKIRQQRDARNEQNIPDFIKFSARAGLSMDDIDKLSIIHVSGTKGKGSTCAFCESILRAHGYKTGFYSSPHLLEVRERIRIDGRPLAKQDFSHYFWQSYDRLLETKDSYDGNMPAYFRFLTIMAFQVFLHEEVDVAIIEVGIGGQYDCTNAIRSPVVCGISSLGYDHTSILGDTLDKIAWHKAGILKEGTTAITVPQRENSLQVILDRAQERQCPVKLAPPLETYNWRGNDIDLGLAGRIQYWNASLAMQLCHIWMQKNTYKENKKNGKETCLPLNESSVETIEPFPVTDLFVKGLKRCTWPGRNQVLRWNSVTFFLDGAHTPGSIEQCVDWFLDEMDGHSKNVGNDIVRVLIFNTTGDRNPDTLLRPLIGCKFDAVAFCPNITHSKVENGDQTNYMVTEDSQQARCIEHKRIWIKLLSDKMNGVGNNNSIQKTTDAIPFKRIKLDTGRSCFKVEGHLDTQNDLLSNGIHIDITESDNSITSQTFECIKDTLCWATQGHDPDLKSSDQTKYVQKLYDAKHIHVLVTGSLHLVGGVLKVIDPDLNDSL